MTEWTLTLDPTRCEGHGFCHEALPELIDLDEWGYPLLQGGGLRCSVAPALVDDAERAVHACPHGALALLARP